jgi:chloramphenicol-sensitive protein RarD
MNSGNLFAFFAFLIWGLFPLYFRLLQTVPALELVAHRIVWSCLLLVLVFTLLRGWKALGRDVARPRIILFHVGSAAMIGLNWFIYVWAVNNNLVLESSLGYFLNPLLNIVLGVLFFRERLHKTQWLAVALAAAGILTLAIAERIVPWVALSLAASFGTYGVMKKITPVRSQYGLFLETLFLAIPAGILLYKVAQPGSSGWQLADGLHKALLVVTGIVTVVPTLLFALAATRIPLSRLGFLQFLTPTISFLLGVFLYHEPFPLPMRIAFACIWVALALTCVPHRRKLPVLSA